jgi:peptide deformylase
MIDTMEAMPGVGLAAPQIGVMLRLAVVDASETERGQAVRMANPEILHASVRAAREHDEASPNLPGVWAHDHAPAGDVSVQRSPGCEVRDVRGLWATSVQHQIDHLNGHDVFRPAVEGETRHAAAQGAEEGRR